MGHTTVSQTPSLVRRQSYNAPMKAQSNLLDVRVDDLVGVQEGEALQDLASDALHAAWRKVGWVVALRVEEVAAEQLHHEEQVALQKIPAFTRSSTPQLFKIRHTQRLLLCTEAQANMHGSP